LQLKYGVMKMKLRRFHSQRQYRYQQQNTILTVECPIQNSVQCCATWPFWRPQSCDFKSFIYLCFIYV